MEINVTIQAPELVGAINNLAVALGHGAPAGSPALAAPAAPAAEPLPAPVTPAAPPTSYGQPQQGYGFPAYGAQPPAAVPVAPPQAPPAQAAPIQQPPQAPPAAPGAAVPTAPQSYSIDQLSVAAMQLMDAGRQGELVGLLAQFGVQALNQLPKEQLGNFATALRGLGAKI